MEKVIKGGSLENAVDEIAKEVIKRDNAVSEESMVAVGALQEEVSSVKSALNSLATKEQLAAVYGKLEEWGNIIDYLAHNIVYTSDSAGAEAVDMIEEVEDVNILSIVATYTGSKVIAGTSLEDIKGYITCLVNYDTGFSAYTNNFTLSGTITTGSNTITVSYSGYSDTITVIGVSLTSITAVYNGSSVIEGTNVELLRSDIVVTANYSDSTSEVVTDYTISGTISVGTNTVTISYGGQTATISVTGTADIPYGLVTPDKFAQSGATTTNTFGSEGFPLTYNSYKLVLSFIMASMTGHSVIVVAKANNTLWGYNGSNWFVSNTSPNPSEQFVLDTENISTMTINNINPSIFDQGGTLKIGDGNSGFNAAITFVSYKFYGVDSQGNETLLSDVRPTSTVGQLEDRVVNTKTTAFSNTTGFTVVELEE